MEKRPTDKVSRNEALTMTIRDFTGAMKRTNRQTRIRKCCMRLGITSVEGLIQRSAEELLEQRNFGETCLRAVRERLQELDLKLRDE